MPEDAKDVEIITPKSKKERSYEDRMMRALSAINGNLERVAVSLETLTDAVKNGVQLDSPATDMFTALGRLFASPKKKRGHR